MSWWPFGKKEEPVLPTVAPAVAPTPAPLKNVVVVANSKAPMQGATATQMPPNTLTGAQLSAGVLSRPSATARRANGYVALGGSRKKSKSKSKKAKKTKAKKAKKANKSSKRR
jgi:hypothetical protein